MAQKRKLPIGIQTFREIREDGCYYVDKTGYALRLAEEGKHYFLSRPRRFGKSLFLDTLKELFECREELFRGLDIHGRWDWSAPHPVVRLDFGGTSFDEPGVLPEELDYQLGTIEERAGVAARPGSASVRFRRLIEALHEQFDRRVVVLVDEYDKPILDALETPELAVANRAALRRLYSAVKFSDAHIRLSFFTGVSKFSKTGLFSGLNNLHDLTLSPRYATICGYTESDLDAVFAPELEGMDREKIRRWYDGYGWSGAESVYNPYDLLFLFSDRVFKHYWFETGTPAFLVRRLLAAGVSVPRLDGKFADDDLLSAFDVEDIGIEALMFQTGYLTIAGVDDAAEERRYRLGYPNYEVRTSFNRRLLRAMTPRAAHEAALGADLRGLLAAGDFAGVEAVLRTFFAGIPYNWHVNNDIGDYEGYYASVLYSLLVASGVDVRAEDVTSRGRLDMAAVLAERVCVFEFKVVEDAPTGAALAQLRERRYADKHRRLGREVHLVGVEFSRESHEIATFEAVTA